MELSFLEMCFWKWQPFVVVKTCFWEVGEVTLKVVFSWSHLSSCTKKYMTKESIRSVWCLLPKWITCHMIFPKGKLKNPKQVIKSNEKLIISGVQLTISNQRHSLLQDTFHSFMTTFSFFITSAATLTTYIIRFYSCEFSVNSPKLKDFTVLLFFLVEVVQNVKN